MRTNTVLIKGFGIKEQRRKVIKLSRLTDYAFIILSEMVRAGDERLSATAISESTGVSEPTASKVMKILAKSGVLLSVRGAKGGYVLAAVPEQISVARVVEVMEGPIALTACVEESDDRCAIETSCPLRGRWNPVNMIIQSALEGVSLQDLVEDKPHHILNKAREAAKEAVA